MGLLGYAVATFMWGTSAAAWYSDPDSLLYIVPMVLIFGGLAQFIASMWSYRKGDMFRATVMGCFGAFNAIYATMLWLQHSHRLAPLVNAPHAIGVFLLCFAYIAFFLMFAAGKVNNVAVAVMLFLWISCLLMGLGNLLSVNILGILRGWSAIISALLAFYGTTALVINSLSERAVLGMGNARGAEAHS
jgi:hypothetical protein